MAPPRRLFVDRLPNGKIDYRKSTTEPAAAAYTAARRAIMADPDAVLAAIERHGQTADIADVIAGAVALNSNQEIRTALGRVIIEALRISTIEITDAQREAARIYQRSHNVCRCGLAPRRPRSFVGQMLPCSSSFEAEDELSPDEQERRRRSAQARYVAGRDALEAVSIATRRLVDELVLEDRDPWWLAPVWRRPGEPDLAYDARVKLRGAQIGATLKILRRGLQALADEYKIREGERRHAA